MEKNFDSSCICLSEVEKLQVREFLLPIGHANPNCFFTHLAEAQKSHYIFTVADPEIGQSPVLGYVYIRINQSLISD
jgi:hypothetical protein